MIRASDAAARSVDGPACGLSTTFVVDPPVDERTNDEGLRQLELPETLIVGPTPNEG
jgi:hypothetical protein